VHVRLISILLNLVLRNKEVVLSVALNRHVHTVDRKQILERVVGILKTVILNYKVLHTHSLVWSWFL
jgi:hypothetical protein